MDFVVFRLCNKAPDILREVCLERGWEEYSEKYDAGGGWNLWWKTQGFTSSEYENCRPWQRLNHFPKSANITKKDGLARNLRRMKTSYGGSVFEFFPLTFILPNEYKKFVAEFSKHDGDQRSSYWICKPAEQSCGRGIFIFQDLHDLTYDSAVVVQKYIIKPFLISGYKFDLRLYAIVTSFHPFRLYIYHEGIVRFSTEQFDLSKLDNHFSHLTNTTINKTGPHYSVEKESIGVGCKWTLNQLRVYLYKNNIDDRLLWHRITSIIILTLLSQVQDIPRDTSNCFEMFGFDILVDEKMKPWLLEVNFSPALGNDCIQDELVKRPLLNDILEVLDFSEADIKRGRKEKENATVKKKSLKGTCRVVMDYTPKSEHNKAISSKPVAVQNSKTNLNISAAETGFNSRNPVVEEWKHCTQTELPNKNPDKTQRIKGSLSSANGEKRKKSIQTCKTLHSKNNLYCHQKIMSTSEEFLKATMNNSESLSNLDAEKIDLNESKVPLVCTNKEGDVHIALSEEGQSFCLEQATVDENGLTDLSERDEKLAGPPWTARSQRQTWSYMGSSMGFSKPDKKGNGPPSHLHIRRYNSEISSLVSLKTIDKHVLPHSSTGDLSSQYSSRFSTTARRRNNKTNLTLKPQIGNCILAFPFNEATVKASHGKLDQRVVIEEIRKMLKALTGHIKSFPLEVSHDGSSVDLSKPFWGFRSKLNAFYSSLQPKAE